MFRPAFGCTQHPKAGRNTQQLSVHSMNLILHGRMDCVSVCEHMISLPSTYDSINKTKWSCPPPQKKKYFCLPCSQQIRVLSVQIFQLLNNVVKFITFYDIRDGSVAIFLTSEKDKVRAHGDGLTISNFFQTD